MSVPVSPGLSADTVLVVGLGVTGRAVADAALARGLAVLAADDRPTDVVRAWATERGVELVEGPDAAALAALCGAADAVLPAPGLPDAHPLFAAARRAGRPILSEFDLAGAWDDRPIVAVTGTNGKTTVTTMITAMFEASGRRAAAVGNTETPLVAAIDDPGIEVFVVEASSFRLAHSRVFAPSVATWLNFAPDHLDAHGSLADYEAAKARIWADQGPGDTAVANADDPTVMAHATGPGRVVTFGLGRPGDGGPDYGVEPAGGGALVGPDGVVLVEIPDLWRDLPHDRANALAASATALCGGANLDGVRRTLESFTGLAHRVELVAEVDGIRWYDDSKATAPHATASAVAGFDSVVLIAGGRNKGLDLSVLSALAGRVRAVVGIGEAGPEVVDAFGSTPSVTAASMDDAVAAAARFARAGDAVVLSPGCASFDWYRDYAARGDDFVRAVRAELGLAS